MVFLAAVSIVLSPSHEEFIELSPDWVAGHGRFRRLISINICPLLRYDFCRGQSEWQSIQQATALNQQCGFPHANESLLIG